MGKFIIYQMFLRAFSKSNLPESSLLLENYRCDFNSCGKFNNVTEDRILELKKLSVSAVWYTGVIAHGSKSEVDGIYQGNKSIIKGEAGSPYAIRDYYDLAPELAEDIDNRFSEFDALIERTHNAGLKVIIDFIPNHVFREYKSKTDNFSDENFYLLSDQLHLPESLGGEYYENPAKATGNNCFSPYPQINDWYETIKLNYENKDTWEKMLRILLFWLSKGVDGFRCDMIELVPAEFFGWAISRVKERYPDALFIGEAYQIDNYQRYLELGKFDLLYDKSIYYDTLIEVLKGYKGASVLSEGWKRLGQMQSSMLNFLENHDEQRISSEFMVRDGMKAIPAVAFSALFNKAPFMLYFGQEFGESGMLEEGFSGKDGRTSIFDYTLVPSINRFLNGKLTKEEKSIYKKYKEILKSATTSIFSYGESFDLGYVNPHSEYFNPEKQFAFLRSYKGKGALVVINFDSQPADIQVNIPLHAFEYLNLKESDKFNSRDKISCKIASYDYLIIKL